MNSFSSSDLSQKSIVFRLPFTLSCKSNDGAGAVLYHMNREEKANGKGKRCHFGFDFDFFSLLVASSVSCRLKMAAAAVYFHAGF